MQILLDYSHPRGFVKQVTLDNGEVWALEGECNRCGACCERNLAPGMFRNDNGSCSKLSYETVNAQRVAACGVMWSRPIGCAVYPRDPLEPLYPECSYQWVKVE